MVKGVVVLLAAAAASAANLDFDRGAPAPELVIEGARKEAKATPAEFAAGPLGLVSRWTRDCEDIVFTSKDGLVSNEIALNTTIYRTDCQFIPPAGQICHEVPQSHEHRQVRLRVSGRGALPEGEREVFSVCLDGYWLSARTRQSKRKYDFTLPDFTGDTIEAKVVAPRKP